jgi:predicted metal-binding protein
LPISTIFFSLNRNSHVKLRYVPHSKCTGAKIQSSKESSAECGHGFLRKVVAMGELLQQLLQGACLAGATKAAILAVKDIVVEDELADRCRRPRCENYGLSRSCPPHVAGPAAFRETLEAYEQALFFKIDVPAEMLYSSDSRELFQLLHEIAAGVEQSAIRLGMAHAKAYAGDSCKRVFCHDQTDCQALMDPKKCRHPQSARPSMSGFGVNVAKLLRSVGWATGASDRGTGGEVPKTTYVCGLVLLY